MTAAERPGMALRPGTFVWYELATADPGGAIAFYRAAMGWSERDAGIPGVACTLLLAGERPVADILARPGAGEAAWLPYIAVADVDATAAAAADAGGTVRDPPADIPGIGRFAVVADPQGATFALFRGPGDPPEVPPDTPGFGGWHDLRVPDWKAAWPFYATLFGWAAQRTVAMGVGGEYQVFGPAGAVAAGGMMNGAGGWLTYFNVDGIDDAVARVLGAGGRVTSGPHEVPGGSLVAQCADPGGAAFAIVSRSRAVASG